MINAGDGAHEHPTQALLDAFTIRQHKGRIAGLRVALVGDIEHSRVVRSNVHLLTKLGAQVTVAGPRTMMPAAIERLGVDVAHTLEAAIEGADVVMMLRVQLERQGRTRFPSAKRVLPPLRPHRRAAGRRQGRRHHHAPRADEPRGGDRQRGGRRPLSR